MSIILAAALAAASVLAPDPAAAKVAPEGAAIAQVVGSSTVYPFATAAASQLKEDGRLVVVEPTGTSSGISFFCSGAGPDYPDAAMASRPIRGDELAFCAENGVTDVREHMIGRSGIVLGQSAAAKPLDLRLRDIFSAVAAVTPVSDEDCTLIPNPARKWSDVRSGLPNRRIEVYGPPHSSGTRASFFELALTPGAKEIPCLEELSRTDPERFGAVVRRLRVDGGWIDAGENDPAIVTAVQKMRGAVGVFGYSHFATNRTSLRAATVAGVAPTEDCIRSGDYPLSRELRIYSKPGRSAAAAAFLAEFSAERAVGPNGYLRALALIPSAMEAPAQVSALN